MAANHAYKFKDGLCVGLWQGVTDPRLYKFKDGLCVGLGTGYEGTNYATYKFKNGFCVGILSEGGGDTPSSSEITDQYPYFAEGKGQREVMGKTLHDYTACVDAGMLSPNTIRVVVEYETYNLISGGYDGFKFDQEINYDGTQYELFNFTTCQGVSGGGIKSYHVYQVN